MYQYLKLIAHGNLGSGVGVYIFTTNPSIVEQLVQELKEFFPSCTVDWPSNKKYSHWTLFTGEILQCRIHRLQDKDSQVATWFFKRLCEEGWKPIEVGVLDNNDYSLVHQFQVIKETKEATG